MKLTPTESVMVRSDRAPEDSSETNNMAEHHKRIGATVGSRGALIINADDWGRDRDNTDRTFQCVSRGTVNSVSAMVFMEDSERSGSIAREKNVDAGLHLNFTTAFSMKGTPSELLEHQGKLARFLLSSRFTQILFHPGLANSFEYVVFAQIEEYQRIYGDVPKRLDGHHHMHLCSNVLFGNLLPAGTIVRRSFSFQSGEKGWLNRSYRKLVDRRLASRHQTTDHFFSITPVHAPGRLEQIFKLSDTCKVEIETHPVLLEEFRFLMGEEILHLSEKIRAAVEEIKAKREIGPAQNQPGRVSIAAVKPNGWH